MARHLAFDWDYEQLRVVAGTVRAGQLRIEQAGVWQEKQNPNVAEAEALGRHLRARLKEAGIAPAPVLVCLGRDRLVLREVRYPSVAAAEEAAVVRFQVLKELTDAAHEVVIDYTPLGEVVPGEEQRALVLTVRRELLAAYQKLCRSAGLKLLALTPRPFGTLACLRQCLNTEQGRSAAHKDGSAQATLALVTATERWSEFCLVRGDTLLVARSLPAGPNLAAEVRRNITVYSAQCPRHTVSALYLAGNGDSGALQESLQQTLGIPVRSFDPLTGADGALLPGPNRGAFAGAVGLLHAHCNGRGLPINFVSPKEPEVARDPNKRRLAVVAGIAALLLVGVVSYCYSELAALDRRINALTVEQMKFTNQMPQIEEEEANLKELSDWSRGSICWLDELYNLTALLPDLKTVQVSEIQGVTQPGAKDKPIGQITLKVLTIDAEQPVDDYIGRLAADKHYVSYGKRPLKGEVKEGSFTRQFEAPIHVKELPSEKYGDQLMGSVASQPPSRGSRARSLQPAHFPPTSAHDANASGIAQPQHGGMVRLVSTPPITAGAQPPANGGQPAPGSVSPSLEEWRSSVMQAAPAAGGEVKPATPAADALRLRREEMQKAREKARETSKSATPPAVKKGAP